MHIENKGKFILVSSIHSAYEFQELILSHQFLSEVPLPTKPHTERQNTVTKSELIMSMYEIKLNY